MNKRCTNSNCRRVFDTRQNVGAVVVCPFCKKEYKQLNAEKKVPHAVRKIMTKNSKVSAVFKYREMKAVDLKEAKDTVEAFWENNKFLAKKNEVRNRRYERNTKEEKKIIKKFGGYYDKAMGALLTRELRRANEKNAKFFKKAGKHYETDQNKRYLAANYSWEEMKRETKKNAKIVYDKVEKFNDSFEDRLWDECIAAEKRYGAMIDADYVLHSCVNEKLNLRDIHHLVSYLGCRKEDKTRMLNWLSAKEKGKTSKRDEREIERVMNMVNERKETLAQYGVKVK